MGLLSVGEPIRNSSMAYNDQHYHCCSICGRAVVSFGLVSHCQTFVHSAVSALESGCTAYLSWDKGKKVLGCLHFFTIVLGDPKPWMQRQSPCKNR